ncbi:MAG: DUF3604 domain-containing protein [Gammaproteobacteria bacterium]|nr:MAG: DUF3604 domain-containing protein [Gammaproteobacteria bacterium]
MRTRKNLTMKFSFIIILAGFVTACDQQAAETVDATPAETSAKKIAKPEASLNTPIPPEDKIKTTASDESSSPTNVYFGDTHLHTSYSPDAFLMGNQGADPDTAYRYAKGYPVVHPYHKARIQIGTPLDFLVVSDHGEFMGVIPNILNGNPIVADTETGKRYKKLFDEGKSLEVFGEIIAQVNKVTPLNPDLTNETISRTIWGEIMSAADRHNEPGKFTTFMGWEWSSTPGGANLHRVIVMREGKEQGDQFIPYTALDSDKPEDLWKWLESTSANTGATFLAIPHNSNISQGLMFPLQDSYGNLITKEYAETRMKHEPIVEMTQIKGDSETHPNLSPTDEFADYETYDHLITSEGAEARELFGDGFLGQLSEADREQVLKNKKVVAKAGDYARSALKRGLVIEDRVGANPYKFGMIGSTDSHTAMASAEEDNFHGKMAIDSTPGTKSKDVIPGTPGWDMGAAGLVAIYAEENTRGALFDGMKRKEVYATTGPRIAVRFFGGWDFSASDVAASDRVTIGYNKGVPMGGDLSSAPSGKAPTFMITAMKGPVDANLDRIQVVKGWLDTQGNSQEKVFNVALADDRSAGADGKIAPVGNTVDLKTGNYSNTIGDAQLAAIWTDPEFDAGVRAFYYVRVLQIPTPRHTLFDTIALNLDPKESGNPATIQERAYTSPIWYNPEN